MTREQIRAWASRELSLAGVAASPAAVDDIAEAVERIGHEHVVLIAAHHGARVLLDLTREREPEPRIEPATAWQVVAILAACAALAALAFVGSLVTRASDTVKRWAK
jgi:hypothetical protein